MIGIGHVEVSPGVHPLNIPSHLQGGGAFPKSRVKMLPPIVLYLYHLNATQVSFGKSTHRCTLVYIVHNVQVIRTYHHEQVLANNHTAKSTGCFAGMFLARVPTINCS